MTRQEPLGKSQVEPLGTNHPADTTTSTPCSETDAASLCPPTMSSPMMRDLFVRRLGYLIDEHMPIGVDRRVSEEIAGQFGALVWARMQARASEELLLARRREQGAA